MLTLEHAYLVGGSFFAALAWLSAIDLQNPRRFTNAAFWGLMAVSFLGGSYLGDLLNGVLALCLVVLAVRGLGLSNPATSSIQERRTMAMQKGNRLFLPALIIPATALTGTLLARYTDWGELLIDPGQATLISLVLGVLFAIAAIWCWLRPPLLAPLQEGRRLMDAVGWAALLPQMLASLGAVFLLAGVGEQVGILFANYMPLDTRTMAVSAYCLGMALFGLVHYYHGQCLCRISGNDRRRRIAVCSGRPGGGSGPGLCAWHAGRLLRHPDDADGSQL